MTYSVWKKNRFWKRGVAAGLVLVLLCLITGWTYFSLVTHNLPAVEDMAKGFSVPSTYIYDRDGRLLYERIAIEAGKHTPLPLEQISPHLQNAVISTEDDTFYYNPGFSPKGILRSAWINFSAGRVVAGGSTITQQLVRNLLFSPQERREQSLVRKIREAALAFRATQRYSKDQILEMYLNQTYFGNFAYGVQAAAHSYFGVSSSELSLAQAAMLAGMIQSPAMYNPLENQNAAKARQEVVLGLMAKRGYITAEEAELALREPLFFSSVPFPIEAPHFSMYVSNLMERELGLDRVREGGLRVYTTLDLDAQHTAEAVIRRRLTQLGREDAMGFKPQVENAALVAIDPRNGEILALVGSPDYFNNRINGAINATLSLRQPGSALKPFTYAIAFSEGYTSATMIMDVQRTFETAEGFPYTPRNYDLKYHGPVSARVALGSSYNVPAVIVLDDIGVDRLAELLSRLGIRTLAGAERYGLSLTLGGGEVRLMDLTTAYAALAAEGRRVEPIAIRRIEDAEGHILREWSGGPTAQTISPEVAYLVTDILSDESARLAGFGPGSVLGLSRPAAVKTGTTTDWRDNWTIGYTPELVVGVWVGNADNSPMFGVSGVSGAGPIWHDTMELMLRNRPPSWVTRPDTMVEREVCSVSGLLPNPDCPHTRRELFLAGTEPTEECEMHRRFVIDRATGELAAENTPHERIMERVYLILPPEAQAWARENHIPSPPVSALAQALPAGDDSRRLYLTSPASGSIYRISPTLPLEVQRIEARAEAVASMQTVEFYVNDRLIASVNGEPFAIRWELERGEHTFFARGRDGSGDWFESRRVTITVR